MKILLINLPREGKTRDFTTPDYLLKDFVCYPPLGLLAIATGIDSRHTVKVIDVAGPATTIAEVVRQCLEYKPDLLGISAVTCYLYALAAVTRAVKQKDPAITIVAGGPHANYFPRETMELGNIDYAMTGFCEKTFGQLIEALDSSQSQKKGRLDTVEGLWYRRTDGTLTSVPCAEDVLDLDELPFPDRSLIDLDNYFTAADRVKMTTMYSSRGCPFRCIYCDVQEKKFHFKSARRVVDEFEEIVSLGIREIFIFDDTFNLIRQRVVDICNEIIRRKVKVSWSARVRVYPFDRELASLLKKSGCNRLHAGVESLDPATLKYMRKGITLEQIHSFFRLCNEFGLKTVPYFMVGFPGETREYREHLFENVLKLNSTYVYFNILCPIPKTEYYESLLKQGVYKEDFWAKFIAHPTPDFDIPLPRSRQEHEELQELVDSIHRRFLLSPRFVVKEFMRSLTHPRMLLLKIRLAFVLVAQTLVRRKKKKGGGG